jgi:hypothetical protein
MNKQMIRTCLVCMIFISVASVAFTESYPTENFFSLEAALEADLEWTYHFWGLGGEGLPFDEVFTARVEEQQVLFGTQFAWEISTWSGGLKTDSHFYISESNGIFQPKVRDRICTPPLKYLPEVLTVGQPTTDTVDVSWTFENGTVLNGPMQWTTTPMGMESVTVPAGTFTALRVDWEGTTTGYWTDGWDWKEVNDHTGSIWFVQGLGIIKRMEVGSETNYRYVGDNWVLNQQDFQDHTMELIPALVLLEGDANHDGVVSAGDYASVQANFGNTGIEGIQGDANLDGVVSAGDYSSVQANFGNTSSAQVTPEPATLSLLLFGGFTLLKRRRK